jgi:hypothetical protein
MLPKTTPLAVHMEGGVCVPYWAVEVALVVAATDEPPTDRGVLAVVGEEVAVESGGRFSPGTLRKKYARRNLPGC